METYKLQELNFNESLEIEGGSRIAYDLGRATAGALCAVALVAFCMGL